MPIILIRMSVELEMIITWFLRRLPTRQDYPFCIPTIWSTGQLSDMRFKI